MCQRLSAMNSYLFSSIGNIPVKVNHKDPQAYNRGLSDDTWNSDNNNSFLYHSDIILVLQMLEI